MPCMYPRHIGYHVSQDAPAATTKMPVLSLLQRLRQNTYSVNVVQLLRDDGR